MLMEKLKSKFLLASNFLSVTHFRDLAAPSCPLECMHTESRLWSWRLFGKPSVIQHWRKSTKSKEAKTKNQPMAEKQRRKINQWQWRKAGEKCGCRFRNNISISKWFQRSKPKLFNYFSRSQKGLKNLKTMCACTESTECSHWDMENKLTWCDCAPVAVHLLPGLVLLGLIFIPGGGGGERPLPS